MCCVPYHQDGWTFSASPWPITSRARQDRGATKKGLKIPFNYLVCVCGAAYARLRNELFPAHKKTVKSLAKAPDEQHSLLTATVTTVSTPPTSQLTDIPSHPTAGQSGSVSAVRSTCTNTATEGSGRTWTVAQTRQVSKVVEGELKQPEPLVNDGIAPTKKDTGAVQCRRSRRSSGNIWGRDGACRENPKRGRNTSGPIWCLAWSQVQLAPERSDVCATKGHRRKAIRPINKRRESPSPRPTKSVKEAGTLEQKGGGRGLMDKKIT